MNMVAFGKKVVKFRIPILIISILLLIPAGLGYVNTRVNYDVLTYLPEDIETMQGQDILVKDFGTGAFSMFIVDGMEDKDVSALKAKIEKVDHVQKVLWCCGELGLPFERIDAGMAFGQVNTPEYRAMNPNGRVPTLVDDGFVLWVIQNIGDEVA